MRHTIPAATEDVLAAHRPQRRVETRHSKEGVRRGRSSNCNTTHKLQDPSAETPDLGNTGANAQQKQHC